jgi:hypothetical protein
MEGMVGSPNRGVYGRSDGQTLERMFFFRFHLRAPWSTEPHVALTLQYILLFVYL